MLFPFLMCSKSLKDCLWILCDNPPLLLDLPFKSRLMVWVRYPLTDPDFAFRSAMKGLPEVAERTTAKRTDIPLSLRKDHWAVYIAVVVDSTGVRTHTACHQVIDFKKCASHGG